MKTVYLVRHGESEDNAGTHLVQGPETPLTKLGHEQARFIAERASKLEFEVIIASQMRRAQQTASHIAEKTGKSIVTEPLIAERSMPTSVIGKPRDDLEVEKIMARREESMVDASIRVEDAENFSDMSARAGRAMEYLAARPEKKILVVSHGIFLRTLVARIIFGESLTGEEFKKVLQAFRTTNTGLTLVEHKPKYGGLAGLPAPEWTIRAWNDHAHLG